MTLPYLTLPYLTLPGNLQGRGFLVTTITILLYLTLPYLTLLDTLPHLTLLELNKTPVTRRQVGGFVYVLCE